MLGRSGGWEAQPSHRSNSAAATNRNANLRREGVDIFAESSPAYPVAPTVTARGGKSASRSSVYCMRMGHSPLHANPARTEDAESICDQPLKQSCSPQSLCRT